MADDVYLGMDLAVARVADELRQVSASGPSPLRDVAYQAEATVLWRWVDASEDAADRRPAGRRQRLVLPGRSSGR